MDTALEVLKTIEVSIEEPSSPLAGALRDLADSSQENGTCLLLEHEGFGEALIADPHWPYGLADTKNNRDRFAVVDLRGAYGFLRVAVLAAPAATGLLAPAESCDMVLAALRAIEAVSEIGTQVAADVLPSGIGLEMIQSAPAVHAA